MNADRQCVECCESKAKGYLAAGAISEEDRERGLGEVKQFVTEKGTSLSAPELMAGLLDITEKYVRVKDAYVDEKKRFNDLVLREEHMILREIHEEEDRFLAGIQYAIMGNYIDFGALKDVQESKFRELLKERKKFELDPEELENLRQELASAKKLLYILDNAGEAVLDKIFIRILKELYPQLEIRAMVRGSLAMNDVTMEDAQEIELDKLIEVMSNGSSIPGTVPETLPDKEKEWLTDADLTIAKGQGNFEGMHGSGYNVYYLFLCKCDLFTRKFGVKQFTPILKNERRISR